MKKKSQGICLKPQLVVRPLGIVALFCKPHAVQASVILLSLSSGPSSWRSQPLRVSRPPSPSRTLSGSSSKSDGRSERTRERDHCSIAADTTHNQRPSSLCLWPSPAPPRGCARHAAPGSAAMVRNIAVTHIACAHKTAVGG